MSARRRAGFTLFEVLGVILVTTLLLSVASSFFINLSTQATRATENTREVRRASALLDRIASDLEHTLLVRKPSELDPLAHPWIFLGESRFERGGADQLKFVRRATPRSSVGPASDLALVAYTLEHSEKGEGFELRRWSTSELPDGLDRTFPPPSDPDAYLVLDEIEAFSLRFLDEQGAWNESWDSSQLLDSSELPRAVEIAVALRNPLDDPNADSFDDPVRRYVRQVLLPLRAIPLEELLDPEGAGDEARGGEDGEGVDDALADITWGCVDFSKLGLEASVLAALETQAANNPDVSIAPYADYFPGPPPLRPGCL